MIYVKKIGIDAPSDERAEELAKALVQIKNALSDEDLLEAAKILKERPGIIKTVKKFFG